jgi:dTDP-4-dehydrorhamnose reductase
VLLVTGASGYLGAELVARRPEASGTRFSRPGRGERLDVRDAGAVLDLFERLEPSAVIHTAYRPDDRATTLGGAEAAARAAAAVEARLVHLSTDVVFGGDREGLYTEADEPRPVTEYGRWKAEAELAVAAAHPEALIVRTSLLYGGARPGFQERLAADPDAVFFSDELRCPIQVGDLAEALLELAEGPLAGLSGVLHVAGADVLDRLAFARLLAGAAGRDPERLRGTTVARSVRLRARNCALSSERARGLLTTRLRGAREVLERSADPMIGRPSP